MSLLAHSDTTENTENSAYTIPFLCDDITTAIIDCLDGSPVDHHLALVTCSQVCRAWTHRSQTHLLRRIVISNENRLAKFISALPTLSERVRNLIRSLLIRVRLPYYPEDIYQLGLAETVTLLKALPRLDSLILSGVQLEIAVEDPLRQLVEDYLSCRRPIQAIKIHNIRSSSSVYPHLAEIATYVDLFQSIFNLSISLYDLHVEDDFNLILPNPSTHINTACIDGPVSLIRLLHALSAKNSLRSLEFRCRPDVTPAVEELLADNSESMNVLELMFAADCDEFELLRLGSGVTNVWSIDASTLTNLRKIELSFWLASSRLGESIVHWGRMVDIIRHLSAAPVESIVMSLSLGSVNARAVAYALRSHPWADLDAVLQRYNALNKPFTLTLHADCDISRSMAREWMEIIEEGLPSLKTRIGEARKVHLIWMYWDEHSMATVDWDVLKTESVQAQSS